MDKELASKILNRCDEIGIFIGSRAWQGCNEELSDYDYVIKSEPADKLKGLIHRHGIATTPGSCDPSEAWSASWKAKLANTIELNIIVPDDDLDFNCFNDANKFMNFISESDFKHILQGKHERTHMFQLVFHYYRRNIHSTSGFFN
jgi:hypothetical protein